jgi:hypothetical protein
MFPELITALMPPVPPGAVGVLDLLFEQPVAIANAIRTADTVTIRTAGRRMSVSL